MAADFQTELEREFEAATSYKPNKADWLEGAWAGLGHRLGRRPARRDRRAAARLLQRDRRGAHPGARRTSTPTARSSACSRPARQAIETGEGIDWATGEALAFGTLLRRGHAASGSRARTAGRGTFSQRHAVLVDQENEQPYLPLNNIRPGQAPFEVIDSPLSEAGVLGFEYGFSLADPKALVIWEAQFGDFANGAQVIIDQFITSGEAQVAAHVGPRHAAAPWL